MDNLEVDKYLYLKILCKFEENEKEIMDVIQQYNHINYRFVSD